jgi:hypothetical protein
MWIHKSMKMQTFAVLLLIVTGSAYGQTKPNPAATPRAGAAAPAPVATATPVGGAAGAPTGEISTSGTTPQSIALPKAYQSIIVSASALVTTGTTALKTLRSEARTSSLRKALTERILSSIQVSSIVLDKDNNEESLSDTSLLCKSRQDYIKYSSSLNYLSSLNQKLSATSAPAVAPTDIVGALKLMFASASYLISLSAQTPAQISASLAADAKTCESDLAFYDRDYYGATVGPAISVAETEAVAAGLPSLGFLGPIGTLIDTFTSIVTPIFIKVSTIEDENRRREVIETALNDPKTRTAFEATGKQLAEKIDGFASTSRRNLAGSFVEQLVQIRQISIDLSKTEACKSDLTALPRLPSGAPNAEFIICWQTAWAQIQPRVASLAAIGDSYDALADAGSISARKLLGTILADYRLLSVKPDNAQDTADLNVFWGDVTEFISLASAINTAASKANISGLKSDIQAIEK